MTGVGSLDKKRLSEGRRGSALNKHKDFNTSEKMRCLQTLEEDIDDEIFDKEAALFMKRPESARVKLTLRDSLLH